MSNNLYLDSILNGSLEDLDINEQIPEPTTEQVRSNIELADTAAEASDAIRCVAEKARDISSVSDHIEIIEQAVSDTKEMVASVEGYRGTAMTQAEAGVLHLTISQRTRQLLDANAVIGSLEDFGVSKTTDEILSEGVEGLGNFLSEMRAKIADNIKLRGVRIVQFFKDLRATVDSVSKRCSVLRKDIALRTAGEGVPEMVQLPLAVAISNAIDGKVIANPFAELQRLQKIATTVFVDQIKLVNDDIAKVTNEVDKIVKAKNIDAYRMASALALRPYPDYIVTNIVDKDKSSPSVVVKCSAEMLGGQKFISTTPVIDAKRITSVGEPTMAQVSAHISSIGRGEVCIVDANKPNPRIDVTVDTMTLDEMVKVLDAVDGLIAEAKTMKLSYREAADSWTAILGTLRASLLNSEVNIIATVDSEGDVVDADYATKVDGFISELGDLLENIAEIDYAYSIDPAIDYATYVVTTMNNVLSLVECSAKVYPRK